MDRKARFCTVILVGMICLSTLNLPMPVQAQNIQPPAVQSAEGPAPMPAHLPRVHGQMQPQGRVGIVGSGTLQTPSSPQASYNLRPYTPAGQLGWDAPLILSASLDATRSDSYFWIGDTVYMNWAVLNEGDDISVPFAVCLDVGGSIMNDNCYTWSGGLLHNQFLYLVNVPVTFPYGFIKGTYVLQLFVDRTNAIVETNEVDNTYVESFYWDQLAGPDLLPYAPPGWSWPLALSSTPDGSEPRLYADQPVYFSLGVANGGGENAGMFDNCVYIDGELALQRSFLSLNSNYYNFWENQPGLISTESGWHTVTLEVDCTDLVAEADETNNTWSADFYWESSSLPNFHAYQPDGWDDALVVSAATGTHTLDNLTAGGAAYLDWAVINDGWGDVASNSGAVFSIYVDGALRQSWAINFELPSGWYLYLEDYNLGGLAAGWHTLGLLVDPTGLVDEANEKDNWYARDFYWNQAGGAPLMRVQPASLTIMLPPASAGDEMKMPQRAAGAEAFDARAYPASAELTPLTHVAPAKLPLAPRDPKTLLSSVNLYDASLPVGNQGNSGSCVGWSSSYYIKSLQEGVDQGWALSSSNHQFSPNYIWNQIQISSTCGGTYPADALRVLSEQGDVPLSVFPFNVDCKAQPTQAMRDQASGYRAENYGAFFQQGGVRPTDATINEMKAWLSGGNPVLMALPVTPEFDQPAGTNCMVDLPVQGASRGGHAVAIVGYEDDIGGTGRGGFRMVNSWSTGYGCSGFAYLTYDWVKANAYEAWWVRDIRTGGAQTRDFTIFNDGTANLTISNISGGAAWLNVILPEALPFQVAPGQGRTVELSVNAAGLSGTYTTSLQVYGSDAAHPAATVAITLITGVSSGAAPAQAGSPNPVNGALDVLAGGGTLTLNWTGTDPNGDALIYDVRLGTQNPPTEIVCNDVSDTQCTVHGLTAGKVYYWRVLSSDMINFTNSPVWSFSIRGQKLFLPLLAK
ncbi:MAG TPA: CARDB domain-containing protein [Anaerolineaceae bacterium]|nr:CARDB domain-containing protein [Anaerolineaceae bacterium]HPN51581.1 CARDB domain-containing protein [Anaerolineaceae bacterium]